MVLSIILSGIIGGLIGFLSFLLVMGIIFGGFGIVMSKFFGVRYHGKGSDARHNAEREQTFIGNELYKFNLRRPDIVEKAKENCKKKFYALTASNILSEAIKIENKELNIPTYIEQVISKIKSFEIIKGDKSLSKLEKLEKLNELYQNKTITEDEFNRLKKEIID